MKISKPVFAFLAVLCLFSVSFAQAETLNNARIIEMAKAGLGHEIILKKISVAEYDFDVSTSALIEMKQSGVDDAVISLVLEKATLKRRAAIQSENQSARTSGAAATPKEILQKAKTIALEKVTLNPSRQALEKELMKRPEWKQLNLTIERYKERADLYVEIGFVPMSLVTHRYVYRIFDRRSGVVIAAGETTSWGSLAENLAKHICKSLVLI